MTQALKWTLIGTGTVVFIIVYGMFDPASGYFPRCFFKTVTGYDCPGCGSQRAIHAMLNGHFAEAWHYNALMILSIPLVALLVMSRIYAGKMPRLFMTLRSSTISYLLIIVVLTWWIVRNII